MQGDVRKLVAAAVLAALIFTVTSGAPRALGKEGANVAVVVGPGATEPEQVAAEELAGYLERLYPQVRFSRQSELPRSGQAILVGSVGSNAKLREYLAEGQAEQPGSYAVTTAAENGRWLAVIAGADPEGAVHGVYAVLRKLGCGFYLSHDVMPPPRQGAPTFDGWQLADRPVTGERIVFNWHNFLSGCSTWSLEHWKGWIAQSQKAGYSAVMVHAYGNNPMVSFQFGGRTKPVGYLSTTEKGRDWSTQHVNDVRRLWGGSVFDVAVFGSEAAIVPDEERVSATRRMMHGAFAYAERRGVDVYFAVDVDTTSANPQALVETLPEDARFAIPVKPMRWMNQEGGRMWLANPDTPEGFQYYRAQVAALLGAYPQIDCLVLWFRHNATPWMAFGESDMPAAWQAEYRAEIARTPEAADLWRAPNFFALGKIVKAFDRALEELGRDDVALATGSWRFDFFPPADRFLPKEVKFIRLQSTFRFPSWGIGRT